MIYRSEPKDFAPRFEIVQCYLECADKLLLLHRLPYKSEGDKWGVPGGKVEALESLKQALARELEEETQICLPHSDFLLLDTLYVRYPDYDFKSHMFFKHLPISKDVVISPDEHDDHLWVSINEALNLILVQDQDVSFKIFASHRAKLTI